MGDSRQEGILPEFASIAGIFTTRSDNTHKLWQFLWSIVSKHSPAIILSAMISVNFDII